MNKVDLVDIIIPAYNSMPLLEATIESVLAQTHTEFNIYVVDDDSPDEGKTKKYIESINDPRVHYVHKNNGGPSSARNVGIQISQSPYIAFLDADDLWHPQKLQKQLELLNEHPNAGLVYGLCNVIDENEHVFRKVSHDKSGKLFHHLMRGNLISGSASMALVKRSALDHVGTFREDFMIGEDWELWARIARDYEIVCVPEYLADIRALPSGRQTNHLRMADGFVYILPIMLKEFKPNLIDRARLGGYCLGEATLHYFHIGEIKRARSTIWRNTGYNPFYFLRMKPPVWIACIRIMLSNELLRKIRRKTSNKYRQREAKARLSK